MNSNNNVHRRIAGLLSGKIGKEKVLVDELSLVAFSADAGCYMKKPEIILKPKNEQDIIESLQLLNQYRIPLTFRAGGTSLSGQSISDSVLMQMAGDHWNKVTISDDASYVKTQVGITGARLNQILRPRKVKFGPDPASINSALIGGIIANNASGMSCGTHANSYATIHSARIILGDGTLLDTSDKKSRKDFMAKKPELISKITELRDRIRKNPEQSAFIREKYKIKNTSGYGLNSFTDFEDPIDIILHLMVGSEGTLGLITEASFSTLPVISFRASSLIYFSHLKEACDAVPALKKAEVSAIELMDREALRSVEDKAGIPDFIRNFAPEVTALLIDLEAETEAKLDDLVIKAKKAIENFNLERDFEITRDNKQILEYWKIRKGVFPSVGGMRKPGTAVIIEDIAVKMEYLTSAVMDLRQFLDDSDYKDAVIYGHALDGNLHFIFSQDFENEKELKKYENLIENLTRLIVDKYQGSLKAEHGTGINMAPFVAYEWGKELYSVMKEVKQAFDPHNLLNPGVLINGDPKAHLKNFKNFPLVDESVDKCIECGFCEINCLSTAFTLSARQRIVVQREISRLNKAPEKHKKALNELGASFRYAGDKSCAGDGLCATSCPLDIDTGDLIRKIRNERNKNNRKAQRIASGIAKNFKRTTSFVRWGLAAVNFMHSLFGRRIFGFITSFVRYLSFKSIPEWNRYMPKAAKMKKSQEAVSLKNNLKVVYFPSCISQTMGPAKGDNSKISLTDVTLKVLGKAGYEVLFPENMADLCCGTPWESKGFFDIANLKSSELESALMKISNNGQIPILCDTSPCILRMKNMMDKNLKMYEPFEFIHDFLLDKLNIQKLDKKLAFHITCSSTKMNLNDKFIKVIESCTSSAIIPEEVGCCGFAGDKGFSQPDLNSWALRKLKPQVTACEAGYSNSRTCEIGLSKNSGINYKSIMYLVDEASN
jgi:D-lactate dehydrogenase